MFGNLGLLVGKFFKYISKIIKVDLIIKITMLLEF